MSYKLIEQESTYLELLKEMKTLQHTGSGPVNPAPKEKETKSPVEDGTGTGTKQAATGHPNVIPPIAYLKKELAKEGINIYGNDRDEFVTQIKNLSSEQKDIVRQKLSEMKDEMKDEKKDEKDDDKEKDEMCPKCKCEPCECPDDKKKVSKDVSEMKQALENAIEMCGLPHGDKKDSKKKMKKEQVETSDAVSSDLEDKDMEKDDDVKKGDGANEPAGNAVGEQYSKKIQNRMAAIAAANRGERLPKTRIAGSPSDRAAKMAAFEKQKAVWKGSESKLPNQVQNQRRELPKVDEQMAAAPAAAPASGSGAISAGNIARSDNAGVRRTRRPVPSPADTKQKIVTIKQVIPA